MGNIFRKKQCQQCLVNHFINPSIFNPSNFTTYDIDNYEEAINKFDPITGLRKPQGNVNTINVNTIYANENPYIKNENNPYIKNENNPYIKNENNPYIKNENNPYIKNENNPYR